MKKAKRKGKEKKTTTRKKEPEHDKIELPKPEQNIRPKSELVHSNPFQVSESIVKSIIDKLIVISVRESYVKSLKRVFENYYNNYLINQLNILFATNYLFYYDEPETEFREHLFWNKHYDKTNTWVEITEPNSSNIDRYENAFMKYVNYIPPLGKSESKKNISRSNTLKEDNFSSQNQNEIIDTKVKMKNTKQYSLKIKNMLNKDGQNDSLDILEENSSMSSKDEETKDKKIKRISKLRKSTKLPINNSIRKSVKMSLSPRKEPPKENNSKSPKDIQTDNNNNTIEEQKIVVKNSRKQPILAMNFKEIPGIEKEFDFDKFSPPDVSELRKEIEEEKIRKIKEEKKKAIIKKITITNSENKDNTNENKFKIIDSNKITFDSNGKIINFKPIKIETFSKDFASLKNAIKAPDNNTNLKKNLNKRIKTNKGKEFQNDKNPIDTKDLNEKEKDKEKEIITKNPEDDPNGTNKNNFVKVSTERNERIVPSGSNFSIMLPNIGVILKEDDKIKEGNRDFGKFFKKYSLKDYDKILKDYLPLQNKTILKSKMNQVQINTVTNMNLTSKKVPKNLINQNTSFKYSLTNSTGNNNNNINNLPLTQTHNINTELSNPLMNQQETNQENDNNTNINNNSSFIKTNKSNISYVFSGNNLYTMSRMHNNNTNFNETGLIRLNKNCSTSSLKNEIDNLKDLNNESNFNFYLSTIKLKSKNIFDNNYKDFYQNKRSQDIKVVKDVGKNMNELNKKIIMTGEWGNQILQKNNSTGNLLYSKHLTKYQALRELGSSLLNGIKVKLPRERKVDIQI